MAKLPITQEDKGQIIRILSWVSKEQTINIRESLRNSKINPDGLRDLKEKVEAIKI